MDYLLTLVVIAWPVALAVGGHVAVFAFVLFAVFYLYWRAR
jgi:hypothetical protein